MSTKDDIEWLTKEVDSIANGITMCTGSYGVRADNDLADIVRKFGSRVHFTHLRSTQREENPKTFHEASHLAGDVDMYDVVSEILREEQRREKEGKAFLIPMRPDHGHQILDKCDRITNLRTQVLLEPKCTQNSDHMDCHIYRTKNHQWHSS